MTLYHDSPYEAGLSDQAIADETEAIDDFRRATAAYRSTLLDIQSRMSTTSNRDTCQEILDALPSDATKLALQMRTALEERKDG